MAANHNQVESCALLLRRRANIEARSYVSCSAVCVFLTCIGKEKYYYICTLLLFIEKQGIFFGSVVWLVDGICWLLVDWWLVVGAVGRCVLVLVAGGEWRVAMVVIVAFSPACTSRIVCYSTSYVSNPRR
jgi:hypothetical protein